MKQYTTLLVALISLLSMAMAGDESILFHIDDEPVSVSEFEYIYNKNNFNNKADYSERSIKEYLDLYINFRLKVKEAEAMGLDKDAKLISELKVYQTQLYNSFFDREHLNVLVDEAMERSTVDVHISHIFISASENSSEETVEAGRVKAKAAYAELQKGSSFAEVAKIFSDDKYTKDNGGDLTYYTALQIAYYPLECAAYETSVGQYSEPIQTALGFHIVKVNDKRPARGKAKASVIKIFKKKSDLNGEQIKGIVSMIADELTAGGNFADYAKKYSEDKATKGKGGEMDWFGIAQYDARFENAVFNLKNIGDIAAPFETEEAWYIVKLDDLKTVTAEDGDRDLMTKKVQQSDRYKIMYNDHLQGILIKHGFELVQPAYDNFREAFLEVFESPQDYLKSLGEGQVITRIAGSDYTNVEFGRFISENLFRHRRTEATVRFDILFEEYKSARAIDFHVIEYGNENLEYGALLNEYRDGILLFELMETNVWSKAVQDTAGLRKFFLNNRESFRNPEIAKVRSYQVASSKAANFLRKALTNDPNLSNINWLTKLNKKGISTTSVALEIKKTDALANKIAWKKGLNTVTVEDGTAIYNVIEIVPESLRSFEDSKGFVIAEYQEFLEQKWIEVLREKYEITIDQTVLMGLVKN